MKARNTISRFLSGFMCLLLVFSLAVPKVTFAQKQVHISPELLKEFGKKEQITFLVKLKKQIDPAKVARLAEQKAKKERFSPFKADLAKRSSIVSTMRATAYETQSSLKKYLGKHKKSGAVKDYQSFYIVNALAITATKDVAMQLAQMPEVEKVLPNKTTRIILPVSKGNPKKPAPPGAKRPDPRKPKKPDPKKPKNPKKPTPKSSLEWNIEKVNAPKAWEMGVDGTGRVVANIDTGVQWNHPALKTKYRGYNPSNPSEVDHTYNWFDATAGKKVPYDDDSHGTHTMGTMVGSEANGKNQVGVAPGAKWIAVKAFTPSGGTDTNLLAAGEWLLAPKDKEGKPHPEKAPDVINNSWGGGSAADEWYRPMVKAWKAAGIFAEFSAGNGMPNPGSVANPANYPESFATGATDSKNALANFSLVGPSAFDGVMKPEVCAPGVDVRSSTPGNSYQGGWDGTSMSGPHVSAAVALLRQVDSSLTVAEIENILKKTATPLTNKKYKESPNNGFGHGLLNVYEAVKAVSQGGLGKIKGQVVEPGEDNDHPTYTHVPPTETYEGVTLPLSVNASDNVSVRKVEVSYQTGSNAWKSKELTRSAGNYKNGTYDCNLSGADVATPSVNYKFTITDFGGNKTESETYTVPVKKALGVGYSTNFSEKPAGWSVSGNNQWQWGKPESGPGKALTGENVYATNLTGKYNNSTETTLLMPPIKSDADNTYLKFQHWYDIEEDYDLGRVVVSTDMERWTGLQEFTGNSKGWVTSVVDLSKYKGTTIYVGFEFTADQIVPKQGWYLDNVAVTDSNTTGKKKGKKETTTPKQNNFKPVSVIAHNAPKVSSSGFLPMEATVSIAETGKSVRSNPEDGSYSLTHPVGKWTVKAEAYGYSSVNQQVEVTQNGETVADFTLNPLKKGTITGTITNKSTGQPIPGVLIQLKEDALITPVYTDAQGKFSITAYEGKYTLQIAAPDYYSEEHEVTVSDKELVKDLALKPFLGYPSEIAYDDGTAESKLEPSALGNGWAVKMSLAPGKKAAMLTSGLLKFWEGSTDKSFKLFVYDNSGKNGAPGKAIAGPIEAKVTDGNWTEVDLKNKALVMTKDFYLVYVQTESGENAPELAVDESGELHSRSWQLTQGSFAQLERNKGNLMVRAKVNYEVETPIITSPTNGSFTNNASATVEGLVAPNVQVQLTNNGQKVASTTSNAEGAFSTKVNLTSGANSLVATATLANGSTDPSPATVVHLDTTKPKLTVAKPVDGLKTNQQAVTVSGTASDANLASVTVNGQTVNVQSDGSYSHRVLLEEGKNNIEVVATDRANNCTTKSVTVDAKFSAPVLQSITPDKDQTLKSGQSITVELNSEPGLSGEFIIQMPLINPQRHFTLSNPVKFKFDEQSPGHYVAYWTATSNLKNIKGATIEVTLRDAYGNVTHGTANGKLFINLKK